MNGTKATVLKFAETSARRDQMKGARASVLTLAERCKNILASNWQGQLNTIKADAKGSKDDIYSSKVKYIIRKGKPYIWVPEKDLHNVIGLLLSNSFRMLENKNTIIDERGSFAVTSHFPGPLGNILKSIRKFPARTALTGDLVPLKDEKVPSISESLMEVIQSERKVISESSYTVSGVLSSSNHVFTSRAENLLELLDESEKYVIYKFYLRSCMYMDGNGGTHEVELQDVQTCKADLLAPFAAKLIDGINQSNSRRRALMLFCFTLLNAHVKDALILSIDRKGFDVLGKVPCPVLKDGDSDYYWKEFRFTFKEEAHDIETFCCRLVEMEEEAVKKVSAFSGLG